MDRKEFIKNVSNAMFIGIPVYSVLSCSGSDDDDDDMAPDVVSTDCIANGTSSNIGSNHGHALIVSKADVEAGIDKEYSIQGTSSHNHAVMVLATHFTTLKSNKAVTIDSTSGGGHAHSVTISCA
ncbi:MAG: hypothetical protein O2887_03385 [Bacteroidetes bacterium]|nr:hypothetical protein [Bacteroidota bacterium]MDA1119528.1 hypothetical protein [Bacteroidota bacterium]